MQEVMKKILIIDDDIDVVTNFKKRMPNNIQIGAMSQAQAVFSSNEKILKVDILILDNDANNREESKGKETLEKIKKFVPAETPIIFTSFTPNHVAKTIFKTKNLIVVKTNEVLEYISSRFNIPLNPAITEKKVDKPQLTLIITYNTVNGYNAGIYPSVPFTDMTEEQWDLVIDVNLNSMFNVTKPVINEMLKQNYGRIVNISSVSGQTGFFGQTNYSASKAGVIGFTKALAKEVASKGITVNAIAPGIIDAGLGKTIPEDILNEFLKNIPKKRLGKPEEIAQAVIFLLKNDYITGQVINVNGGLYI